MSKHTPGPWHFRVAYNGDCGIKADGTGVFAESFADIRAAGENNKAEAYANARLIAAAPDLLSALKAIVSFEASPDFSNWARLVRNAEAAVTKAEGQAEASEKASRHEN